MIAFARLQAAVAQITAIILKKYSDSLIYFLAYP
jgi:hypothetical protein